MIDAKLAAAGLKLLSQNPDMFTKIFESELSLPNIPWKVYNGKVFWTTLAEYNGWELQQNMFSKHARLLNPDGIKVAWGTVNGMKKALDRIVDFSKQYR